MERHPNPKIRIFTIRNTAYVCSFPRRLFPSLRLSAVFSHALESKETLQVSFTSCLPTALYTALPRGRSHLVATMTRVQENHT